MSATDPARLREGIEKAERATPLPWRSQGWDDEERGAFFLGGGPAESASERMVGATLPQPTADSTRALRDVEYIVHAANDYPALARAHLELLEAAGEILASFKAGRLRSHSSGGDAAVGALSIALAAGSAAMEAPDGARTGAETEEE